MKDQGVNLLYNCPFDRAVRSVNHDEVARLLAFLLAVNICHNQKSKIKKLKALIIKTSSLVARSGVEPETSGL